LYKTFVSELPQEYIFKRKFGSAGTSRASECVSGWVNGWVGGCGCVCGCVCVCVCVCVCFAYNKNLAYNQFNYFSEYLEYHIVHKNVKYRK